MLPRTQRLSTQTWSAAGADSESAVGLQPPTSLILALRRSFAFVFVFSAQMVHLRGRVSRSSSTQRTLSAPHSIAFSLRAESVRFTPVALGWLMHSQTSLCRAVLCCDVLCSCACVLLCVTIASAARIPLHRRRVRVRRDARLSVERRSAADGRERQDARIPADVLVQEDFGVESVAGACAGNGHPAE